MIYSQIILLMLVLLLITGAPEEGLAALPLSAALSATMFTVIVWTVCTLLFVRRAASADQHAVGQRMEWMALVPFSILLYGIGVRGLLQRMIPVEWMPSLVETACLALYLLLAAISWAAVARRLEEVSAERTHEYVIQRLRLISPALLPYVIISLLFDLFRRAPFFQRMIGSADQELVFMGLMIPAFILLVPVLVKRLWGCYPLWPGALRNAIEEFLARRGVRVGGILVWPAGGETMCTAAVLGFLPRLRYILLTPCVLRHLTWGEIEAVLSHEIAHVKHRHILLYLAFLGAYALVLNYCLETLVLFMLSHKPVFSAYVALKEKAVLLDAVLPVGSVALLMIVYFRFVMGFFMRNFERQADLSVFETQGHGSYIISALNKIALLGGIDVFKKNWHHYGIAERVEFIARAERHPWLIVQHHRRVRRAVFLFFFAAASLLAVSLAAPTDEFRQRVEENTLEFALGQPMESISEGPEWYADLAAYLMEKKRPSVAEIILRKGLERYPGHPELLNNMAWLLLTKPGSSDADAAKALKLAEKAVNLRAEPHVLDTYAEALWRNGMVEEAVEAEARALEMAGENRRYYLGQLEKFRKDLSGR